MSSSANFLVIHQWNVYQAIILLDFLVIKDIHIWEQILKTLL